MSRREDERMRTIKNPAQPPDKITIEQAREATKAVKEKRIVRKSDKLGSLSREEAKEAVEKVGSYRKRGGEGKYKSLKTGKYVSAYYAKRNPKNVYRVDASERARDLKDEVKSEGRTFSDSADFIRWNRLGLTPEAAAQLYADGVRKVSREAVEFSRRFNEQYREVLRDLANS